MLSAQPLHAIVQGLCEKVGRHDAAPHGRGTEPQNSGAAWGGRQQQKKPYPVPVTVHPQPGVSARPKPWQHFTLMRDLSLPSLQPVSRVKVKCWLLTQCRVLKGGAGRQVTQCSEKTNKAHRLPIYPPKLFDEVCSSEIFGHISSEKIEVITAEAAGGEVGFKSHPSLILLLISAPRSSKTHPSTPSFPPVGPLQLHPPHLC